jgi:hypothetical protein
MAEEPTHEDKLYNLLIQMIQNSSTDSDAAKHIKSIVVHIIQNKDDLLHLIRQISSVLSGLDSEDYPYAKIAFEEIDKIAKILYPGFDTEEGEEY